MKIVIAGPAQSGKSTLFAALTGLDPKTGVGVGKVPDVRIDKLAAIFKPKKTTYAEVRFFDPLTTADNGIEKASATALETMRGADLLALAVPCFLSDTADGADVAAIYDATAQELVLRDAMTIEKRLEKLAKERKAETAKEVELLKKAAGILEAGRLLRDAELNSDEIAHLKEFRLLTLKPWVAAGCIAEEQIGKEFPTLAARVGAVPLLLIPAAVEMEVMQLAPAERREYFAALGMTEPGLDRFVHTAYRLMELMAFFTVGEDEVRAWTIRRGTPAPEAAGAVHSDIQRGFIRAEVVHYDDFIAVGGSNAEARKHGKLRLEGKNYIVVDGDIINFRFNV